MKAIDLLISSCSMALREKSVELPNGKVFTFWIKPLTLGERTKAQKQAPGDDAASFALTLLVNKALDEHGQRLFAPGELAMLKNEIPAAVAEKILTKIIEDDAEDDLDEADKRDPKSAGKTAGA